MKSKIQKENTNQFIEKEQEKRVLHKNYMEIKELEKEKQNFLRKLTETMSVVSPSSQKSICLHRTQPKWKINTMINVLKKYKQLTNESNIYATIQ